MTTWLGRLLRPLLREGRVLDRHVREGRFQRSLSAVAGVSALLGGVEVALQHYRGSFNQRVMYTPVVLSSALFATGVGGAAAPKLARTALPVASALLITDGVVGFGFHLRGIARKPGGFRIPIVNLIMGPPVFAPLLLGIGGVLGLVASRLRPESSSRLRPVRLLGERFAARVREGRLRRTLAAVTAGSAVLNGIEALYSHYKTNFAYRAQWLPVALAPPLAMAASAAIGSKTAARRVLPPFAILAIGVGGVGFFYHARGVVRRPGGLHQAGYNLIYGPPLFAPLLYAASGFMGLLTSMLRRS